MRIQVFSPYMREAVARAGVDDAAVTPYPVPPLADPIAPHENDARPVLLASGRLNKEKGFRQLLGALSRVTSASHLVIAGSGHDRDALEAIARRIYGPHRVTFTGWLSPEDLAGWIERAAIVAMPSMWPEPFGIAGLEAMARARPVVAFDSGGIATWLADGETGVLVPVGDEIALAGAIERLLRDPDARARMGAAGRARAEHEFNLGDHVARVLELYRQVAA
jgi:glycosyltransferase involved in cell wall biosynthesis